jgi:hypothetical protein
MLLAPQTLMGARSDHFDIVEIEYPTTLLDGPSMV